jgi:hypothetical protein
MLVLGRVASQDPAIRAGLAGIGGERVIVVAMDRYADDAGAAPPGDRDRRLAKATRSFMAANPSAAPAESATRC